MANSADLIRLLIKGDGWMTCHDTSFFNSILFMSGQWEGNDERLYAMESCLLLKIPAASGDITWDRYISRLMLNLLSYQGSSACLDLHVPILTILFLTATRCLFILFLVLILDWIFAVCRWRTCNFSSFSTEFQSDWADGMVRMKSCVQQNSVYR